MRRNYLIYLIFFLSIFLCFGVLRAKHDLRWSAWALGDAQNLNAAEHFIKEGFRANYFLTNYHTGERKKVFKNESEFGYYTRYPPLSAIFNALLIKYFNLERFGLKTVSVCLSTLTLLFAFLLFRFFIPERAAFFSVIFMGLSVGYLQFIDCLSPYLYSEFFRFSILLTFVIYDRTQKNSWLAISLLLLFLESINSLDYMIFYQVFFAIYFIKSRYYYYRIWALFVAVPFIGIVLYWMAVHNCALHYGYSSFSSMFGGGLIDKTYPFDKGILNVISFITYFLRKSEGDMILNYGFGYGYVLMLWFLCRYQSYRNFDNVMCLLGIPCVTWFIIFPNHSATFFYTPLHLLPLIALLWGLCVHFYSKNKLVLLSLFFPIFIYTGKYLKEYPNLIAPSTRSFVGDWGNADTEKIGKAILEKNGTLLYPAQKDFFDYYENKR